MNPHYKPETVWQPSQAYNENPYTHKTLSSWIGFQRSLPTCVIQYQQTSLWLDYHNYFVTFSGMHIMSVSWIWHVTRYSSFYSLWFKTPSNPITLILVTAYRISLGEPWSAGINCCIACVTQEARYVPWNWLEPSSSSSLVPSHKNATKSLFPNASTRARGQVSRQLNTNVKNNVYKSLGSNDWKSRSFQYSPVSKLMLIPFVWANPSRNSLPRIFHTQLYWVHHYILHPAAHNECYSHGGKQH